LAIVAVLLPPLLLYYRVTGVWKILRLVPWILATLLVIYAFATAGEVPAQWPACWLAPTLEGLHSGLLQCGRPSVMLAGLALLLATTGREQLIGGIYLLLRPLRHVRLEPQRFAARLWLTVHYVEQRQPQTMRGSLFERLTASQAPMEQPAPQHVDFS